MCVYIYNICYISYIYIYDIYIYMHAGPYVCLHVSVTVCTYVGLCVCACTHVQFDRLSASDFPSAPPIDETAQMCFAE